MLDAATLQNDGFQKARDRNPITSQLNFNKDLSSIANRYKDTNQEVYDMIIRCKSSEPLPKSPYVLPKDHKSEELKGRPIISSLDCPSTKLSKFLSGHLQNLMKHIEYHIASTDVFMEWIGDSFFNLLF